LVTAVTKDLTEHIKANEIIKEIAPLIEGGGGGRPDFAQAGGTKPDRLNQVFRKIDSVLEKIL
jgi:alanyl-tRNA synthetase